MLASAVAPTRHPDWLLGVARSHWLTRRVSGAVPRAQLWRPIAEGSMLSIKLTPHEILNLSSYVSAPNFALTSSFVSFLVVHAVSSLGLSGPGIRTWSGDELEPSEPLSALSP